MMDIFEKVERVEEIQKECEVIATTLASLKILAGTVNAETTHRCMVIATNLGDRSTTLYKEFKELTKDIDEFYRESGLL